MRDEYKKLYRRILRYSFRHTWWLMRFDRMTIIEDDQELRRTIEKCLK
jgi:hypothetical protein